MRLTAARRWALALVHDESGSEILEYAIVSAVLTMACAAAFAAVAYSANTSVTTQQNNVSNYGVNPP